MQKSVLLGKGFMGTLRFVKVHLARKLCFFLAKYLKAILILSLLPFFPYFVTDFIRSSLQASHFRFTFLLHLTALEVTSCASSRTCKYINLSVLISFLKIFATEQLAV